MSGTFVAQFCRAGLVIGNTTAYHVVILLCVRITIHCGLKGFKNKPVNGFCCGHNGIFSTSQKFQIYKNTKGLGSNRMLSKALVEKHPGYWPVYPHICDGVRVHGRLQHLCHVVAHEKVHMVRALFNDIGNGMYNNGFQAINLWVYGHLRNLDNNAVDAPLPIQVI